MPEIIPATEYTNVSCYGWQVKPNPKIVSAPRRILPEKDMDELQRIREMSDSFLGQHRFPDQENFKDKARQLGHPLHSSELVRRVKKLNPALIVEDSINCRGNAAFYTVDATGEKKYTNASFKKGILTEFSVIETDAADLPVRVQYGWREVLLRLVKAGCLSFRQVVRMFGDAETVQATNWRRSIRNFRR